MRSAQMAPTFKCNYSQKNGQNVAAICAPRRWHAADDRRDTPRHTSEGTPHLHFNPLYTAASLHRRFAYVMVIVTSRFSMRLDSLSILESSSSQIK